MYEKISLAWWPAGGLLVARFFGGDHEGGSGWSGHYTCLGGRGSQVGTMDQTTTMARVGWPACPR